MTKLKVLLEHDASVAKVRPALHCKPMPFEKYRPYPAIQMAERNWTNKTLQRAPRWCSVDLRDGNQALLEPMGPAEKLRMYELLLTLGFKEIEVGFPAASQPDFDFVRKLVADNLIPEDVEVQVLCQAREELIARTFDALQGVPRVIFHLYNSTSTLQRDVVFNMDRQGIIDMALRGVGWIQERLGLLPGTDLTLEYSPESFTGTELDFAVEICAAVCDQWGANADQQVILNLPATVEMSTPNIYADQVEWFIGNFPDPSRMIVSLHTHNDRGTGVAATEMGLLAGAERVEGTLFGNGERTGNADIITLAMNLFSQGVDPQLDLHDMPRILEIAEACTKLPVHPRHPYAGELVFTAFSGSHQDAIKKGMAKVTSERWEVPYLPIDPADVKSSYRETVRVNSQSGKGGVAFVLEHHFGVTLTRDHLVEFASIVQAIAEREGGELSPRSIWRAFKTAYVFPAGSYRLLDYSLAGTAGERQQCMVNLAVAGSEMQIAGEGGGPIEAFVNALCSTLNEPFTIQDYHEYSLGEGSDAKAIAQVSIRPPGGNRSHGVGISRNTVTASLEAVVAALNRLWLREKPQASAS